MEKKTIKEPLVSIIMPLYNCEKYLSEAIESILEQSYLNWELLIVDDCSTDSSFAIAKSYAKKDNRIQVFINDSVKHGPGSTRNYGMDRIKGKYTYFIDSDDWIDRELLMDSVTLAEEKKADIIPFGYCIEEKGKTIRKPVFPYGDYEYKDLKKYAHEIIRGTWSECHELIRSDLLREIRHNAFKTGEDICFQMDVLCQVKKVCGIDKEYYHYRVVQSSISHNTEWQKNLTEINIEIWNKEKSFLEYCGLDEDSSILKKAAIERYLWDIYCMCEPRCPFTLKQKFKHVKYVKNKMKIRDLKKGYRCKKIEHFLVKWNQEKVLIVAGTFLLKIKEKRRERNEYN